MGDPYTNFFNKTDSKLTKIEERLEQRKSFATRPNQQNIIDKIAVECKNKLIKVEKLINTLSQVNNAASRDPSKFNLTPEDVEIRIRDVKRLQNRYDRACNDANTELHYIDPQAEHISNLQAAAAKNNQKEIEFHKQKLLEIMNHNDDELIQYADGLSHQAKFNAQRQGEELDELRRQDEDIEAQADEFHNRVKAQNKIMEKLRNDPECSWKIGLTILFAFAVFMVVYAIML